MQQSIRSIFAIPVMATLSLIGFSNASAGGKNMESQAKVEKKAGISRITLSASASKRLGIKYTEVKNSGEVLVAPYNALLYDNNGNEFVFISKSPNVYTRADIEVVRIEGDKVYFSEGPDAGTKLVTYGAAELLGIEHGVGKK